MAGPKHLEEIINPLEVFLVVLVFCLVSFYHSLPFTRLIGVTALKADLFYLNELAIHFLLRSKESDL